MNFKTIILFFSLCILLACNSSKKEEGAQQSTQIKEPKLILDKPLELNAKVLKNYKNWHDYQDFNKLFKRFLNTTQSEALSNAKELNTLALQLRDSLKINSLKTPAFNARLNVLQNETLRLEDMMTIPNLKSEDVKKQMVKILNAFNALNAKLNNLVVQKQLEKELNKLTDSLK